MLAELLRSRSRPRRLTDAKVCAVDFVAANRLAAFRGPRARQRAKVTEQPPSHLQPLGDQLGEIRKLRRRIGLPATNWACWQWRTIAGSSDATGDKVLIVSIGSESACRRAMRRMTGSGPKGAPPSLRNGHFAQRRPLKIWASYSATTSTLWPLPPSADCPRLPELQAGDAEYPLQP
jgi:hypothetical protein